MSATLLFSCAAADETANRNSDASMPTTTDAISPETTSLGRNEVNTKVPDYGPQTVQPEDWPQLSEAQVRKAVNIGLSDPHLENFLRQNNFEVSEVRKLKPFYQEGTTSKESHPIARVTIVLDDPVPLEKSGYTGDICDVGGATGPVTGMVWKVDLVDQRVSSFSPQWNYDVSCT